MHTSKEGPSREPVQASGLTELKQKRSRLSTPGVAILKEFVREHGLHPSPVQCRFLIERIQATDGHTDFTLRRLEDWFRRRRTADATSTSKTGQDTRYPTLTASSIKRLETLSRTQPNPPAEVLLTWSELLFASVQDVTTWLEERNRSQMTPVESPIPSPNPTELKPFAITSLETSLHSQMPMSTPVSVPLPPHYQSSVPPLPSKSVSQPALPSAIPKPIYPTNSTSPSLPGEIMSLSTADGLGLSLPGSANNLSLSTRSSLSAPPVSPLIPAPASTPLINTPTHAALPALGVLGSNENVPSSGPNPPSAAVGPLSLTQLQVDLHKQQAAHKPTPAQFLNDDPTKILKPDPVKAAILNGIREALCNVPLSSAVPTNLTEFNALFAPFSEDIQKLEKLLK